MRINAKINTETIDRLRHSKAIMMTGRLLQIAIVGLVFWLIIDRLSGTSWADVRTALPTNPAYYLLFVIWYFAIPVTELLVYRVMWGVNLARHFGIFLRKRVYNLALVSYSGEAYLAFWARKRVPMREKRIYSTVKDSNVLSALSSNVFTLVLLLVFMLNGQMSVITKADGNFVAYLGLAAAVGLVLVPLILKFRKSIISLAPQIAWKVLLIHLVRFLVMTAAQIGMWAVILPDVELSMWLLFLTAQLVLTRVPFLPNTDLLLAGLFVLMAPLLNADNATVTGMFLASGALAQGLNLAIYLFTSFQGRGPRATLTPLKSKRVRPADLVADAVKTGTAAASIAAPDNATA